MGADRESSPQPHHSSRRRSASFQGRCRSRPGMSATIFHGRSIVTFLFQPFGEILSRSDLKPRRKADHAPPREIKGPFLLRPLWIQLLCPRKESLDQALSSRPIFVKSWPEHERNLDQVLSTAEEACRANTVEHSLDRDFRSEQPDEDLFRPRRQHCWATCL